MNANIIKLMAAGAVNVVKLEGEDKYLLAITTKTTKIFVPMLTLASANWAYVEDDGSEESAKTFEIVDAILKEIKDKHIYGGVYAYRPKSVDPGKVPEHSHTAVEILKGVSGGATTVVPKGFKKMLADAGYTLVEKDLTGPITVRDYSALLADPVNKANFDADAAELASVGATFDKLSLEAKMAFTAIANGEGGVIFEGPTGTGKSWMAKIMAQQFRAPLLNIQIHTGTTPDDLVGTFIPSTSADAKANWEFAMGPLLKAYSEGYQLVVEEVNVGQAGVLAVLNQYTDGTPRITVHKKTYYRHPNFVIYMTMNPGYEGTDPLNIALKNRFIKVNVPSLTKSEYCARAEKYSIALGHKLSTAFFDKVFDFAGTIEKIGNSSQFRGESVKFSIRNTNQLCKTILAKKCSFEQFAAAVATSYLNDLTCNNDNSDKLEALKKSSDIVTAIHELYNLYDFAEMVEVEPADGIAEFLSEDGSMDPDKKTAALKGLRDRIRL